MSGYGLEPLHRDLLDKAAALDRRVRGGTLDEQRAYLTWKYLRNPYLPQPLMWLALHEGQAIAMRGFHGMRWQRGHGADTYLLPAASDSAVLQGFRDSGIYDALHDAIAEDAERRGLTHLLNMSAAPRVALTAILKFGWKSVVPQEVMAMGQGSPPSSAPRSPLRRVVPASVRRLVAAPMRRGRRSSALARVRFGELYRTSTTVVRATRSWAEVADVARRARDEARLAVHLDEAFFTWKFAKPFGSYLSVVADGDSGGGYLVLLARPDRAGVFILDWRAETPDARGALLEAVVEGLGLRNLSIWSATLSHQEVAALEGFRFERLEPASPTERRRSSLLVRPVGDPADPGRWELDGHRLDQATTWSIGAIASDSY
jgi:hypothetical protein